MAKQQKSTAKKNTVSLSPPTTFSKWNLWLMAGIILLITFLSFLPALKNNFINWDDNAYVFENSNLNKPIPEAVKFFFGPHYFVGNYIPLTMITYALEYHAGGLKPHFFHTVNVLIHLLNVLLVFRFIYLLSGKKPLVAGFVSLFFAIHPMHVESVAWVAELKDVLYSFFFLSGLLIYYKHLEKREMNFASKNLRAIALVFLMFLLSVLSKPAAVTFPVVLLLLDFYAKRKFDAWTWIEKLPFFLVAFIFGLVAIKSQDADNLLHDQYTLGQKLLFASHSVLDYLVKFFLPVDLAIFYPYPDLVDGFLPTSYYTAPFILIALFYGIYRTLRHSRLLAFGVLFFMVNILLVLQLISVGEAIMADRYTYLSYIGLFFILGMGFDHLYHAKTEKLLKYKTLVTALLIVFSILCVYLTYGRCKIWKDDDTMATDLLNKFPKDRLALNNKGFILFEQKRYSESIDLYNQAIQSKPDYAMAHINLVNAYLALNDRVSALRALDTALKFVPQKYNLLIKKGYLLGLQQNYPEAIKFYKQAIDIQKENVNGYINLAECYYMMQDYDSGIKTLEDALQFEPHNYILLNNKGYFLFLKKEYAKAMEYFKACLKENPAYSVAAVNLSDSEKALNASLKGTE